MLKKTAYQVTDEQAQVLYKLNTTSTYILKRLLVKWGPFYYFDYMFLQWLRYGKENESFLSQMVRFILAMILMYGSLTLLLFLILAVIKVCSLSF